MNDLAGRLPNRSVVAWALAFTAGLVWSGWRPHDGTVWLLEVLPGVAVAAVLAGTRPWFRFTPLVYAFLLAHIFLLFVGAHYTYAEVPAFERLSEWMGWQRNYFDKLAHFGQGFVPALVFRELFLRFRVVNGAAWRFVLVAAACLAVSAGYELFEWWVALAMGESAAAFLGTQGDPWDTQSDMAVALLGALLAQWWLAGWQDRQIRRLKGSAA